MCWGVIKHSFIPYGFCVCAGVSLNIRSFLMVFCGAAVLLYTLQTCAASSVATVT